jgi:hypothetical protein
MIVGVDCATINQKTGLAFASISGCMVTIEECLVAKPKVRVSDQIQDRLLDSPSTLIALDAPLGWPAALGTHLSKHLAGKAISLDSDNLFRRTADLVIRERLGKAPLEVGANFIARTAVSALKLLAELSELNRTAIRLAWDPSQLETLENVCAIEVYPAGTLRAYQKMGFVKASGTAAQRKRALLRRLEQDGRLRLKSQLTQVAKNEHALDSVICCVAALDFLEVRAIGLTAQDLNKATKEGWIWVRNPDL